MGVPYGILNINPQTELLWSLWVLARRTRDNAGHAPNVGEESLVAGPGDFKHGPHVKGTAGWELRVYRASIRLL